MSDLFPTSPNLNVKDTISTAREFSGSMTLELTDAEILRAFETTVSVINRHREVWRRKFPFDSYEQIADLLEEFEKELSYKLMESVNCLVRVDGTPIFEGQGPVIEWIGKMPGDALHTQGMDHERKTWEVKKAEERNEDYHGQTGITKRKKND